MAKSFFAIGAGNGFVAVFGRAKGRRAKRRPLLTPLTVAKKRLQLRTSSASSRVCAPTLVTALASRLAAPV